MHDKEHLICSVLYEHLRLCKTASVQKYKASMEKWYGPWRDEEHLIVFFKGGLFGTIKTFMETEMSDRLTRDDLALDNMAMYEIKAGIEGSILQTVKQKVLSILCDDDGADDGNGAANHLFKNIREIVPGSKCIRSLTLPATRATTLEQLIQKRKEDVELVAFKEPTFSFECKDFETDVAQDCEYPVVWSLESIKDMIVQCNSLQLRHYCSTRKATSLEMNTTNNHNLSWFIDEMLNIRTKSAKVEVTYANLCCLFDLMGLSYKDLPSADLPNAGVFDVHFSIGEVLPLDTEVGAPIQKTADDLRGPAPEPKQTNKDKSSSCKPCHLCELCIVYNKIKKCVVVSANASESYHVRKHTGETRSPAILTLTDDLVEEIKFLPELEIIFQKPMESHSKMDEIVCAFTDSMTTVMNILKEATVGNMVEVSLTRVLMHKGGYLGTMGDRGRGDDTNRIRTVRGVIEYCVDKKNLRTSSTWAPSSKVLEQFSNLLEHLRIASPERFADLNVQKNQISIILADIVPKKRFVAGQMFQIQMLSDSLIKEIVTELC